MRVLTWNLYREDQSESRSLRKRGGRLLARRRKPRMLTRIYGTARPEAWQLKEHKRRMEEAKKRDHRLLDS